MKLASMEATSSAACRYNVHSYSMTFLIDRKRGYVNSLLYSIQSSLSYIYIYMVCLSEIINTLDIILINGEVFK